MRDSDRQILAPRISQYLLRNKTSFYATHIPDIEELQLHSLERIAQTVEKDLVFSFYKEKHPRFPFMTWKVLVRLA